jgi:hypothetical protein
MRLSILFIWQRRERRWSHGGETINGNWSHSMLLFQGEERKGWRLF